MIPTRPDRATVVDCPSHVTQHAVTGEGTGVQLTMPRPWKLGEPIQFRVECVFFTDHWITDRARYMAYVDGCYLGAVRRCDVGLGPGLSGLYSFIEDIKHGAESVHLRYRAPAAMSFSVTLRILESQPRTFFVACGFDGGYLGIQDANEAGEQNVLFSIADPGSRFQRDSHEPRPRDWESARKVRAAEFSAVCVRRRGQTRSEPVAGARFTATEYRSVSAGVDGSAYYLATGGCA